MSAVVHVSSWSVARLRQARRQKEVFDQLTVKTSCGMAKPAEPSFDELGRYSSKAMAASQCGS